MRILARPAFDVGDLNPYTQLLYSHIKLLGQRIDDYSVWKALRHRYDICHIHWPEYYVAQRNPLKAILGSAGLLVLVCWCRTRGAKIVWTVHNLASHNQARPRTEEFFWKIFTRCLDGYIALSEGGRRAAPHRHPALAKLPALVIPHGHYRDVYPNTMTRREARHHLGLSESAKVILFFGGITPYKNVPQLANVLRDQKDSEVTLLIAGACTSRRQQAALRQASHRDPRVRLHIGFVPRQEVQCYFLASDLVVLPFLEILNSGSALLALSFDRPVLVPAKGAMSELQLKVGSQWVRTYEGLLTVRELNAALAWAIHEDRPKHAPLQDLDWRLLAERTLQAYKVFTEKNETASPTGSGEALQEVHSI